ncbi:MAG: RNase H family protein, partial [Crocosphaera sp.]
DDEEDIPSIEDLEDLEDNYNTNFAPEQVPEPLDQYDNQDNHNSQPSDKNNIKPKPKINNNSSSNKDNNQTSFIDISGKPVNMNYSLLLHGEDNKLPVNTTIDAMRGHGRTPTTRAFEPYKAYGFQERDLAIAYSGNKENPDKQVLFLVGEQHKITNELIDNPNFRQEWSEKEKHSPQELYNLKKKYHKSNEEKLWGLNMTPLGDYRDGKVYSFDTGEEITKDVINKNYQKILEKQKKRLGNQSQVFQESEEQAVKTIDNNSETLSDNENSKTQGENNQDEEVVKVSEISSDNIDKEQEKNRPKLKPNQKLTDRKTKNETSQPTQLTVYCKGISEQNNGGWGYSICEGDQTLQENYGGQENTNKNEMELTAIVNSINKAIELNPKAEITIVTSQSVIDQLKQDSNNQNFLRSQINKIANGRPISFNDEQKDNHPQRMAKVRSLAQKGLESLDLTQRNYSNRQGD